MWFDPTGGQGTELCGLRFDSLLSLFERLSTLVLDLVSVN